MADLKQLEFFLLRYVPDAVKDEFVNIGLVMLEPGANGAGFADVRFTKDWRHALCLDPQADVEMLEALERDIRQHLGEAKDREVLLRKLQDSFSNIIQLSSTKACLAEQPAGELETLASLYFERQKGKPRILRSGRQEILTTMREAFDRDGLLAMMTTGVPVEPYTRTGDPFKIDFAYRIRDTIRFFHAVSLKASVEQAIALAARYPKIAHGIERSTKAQSSLIAVVDDDLDRGQDRIQFALSSLEEEHIQVAVAAEMPLIAERARKELQA